MRCWELVACLLCVFVEHGEAGPVIPAGEGSRHSIETSKFRKVIGRPKKNRTLEYFLKQLGFLMPNKIP